jgi:hypothetical protein
VFPEHAEKPPVGWPSGVAVEFRHLPLLRDGLRRFVLQDSLRRRVNASSPRPPGTPRAPRFMAAANSQGPCQCDWPPRATGETLGRKCSLKPLDGRTECQNENCSINTDEYG